MAPVAIFFVSRAMIAEVDEEETSPAAVASVSLR